MEKVLLLKNVLEQMRQVDQKGEAVPFSLEWRTWNNQNKMGGRLLKADNAILCFRLENNKVKNWEKVLSQKQQPRKRKKPNHHDNYTRNIELHDHSIVKVNVLTITKFNGIEVVY
ncbi:hypothetical protein [Aquimarina aggregata]|uniref:hypothetical protein n=1 Tax=Aquimarina aggregata TaxID=1642818 RepID=UPI0024928C7A|nr:hypothetical protein [Aquimarina aggregata]